MSNGARRGTSRSGFLKQAAGASMAVAGAGVGAGVIASGAAAAGHPSYTAGRFALDIDGVSCGWMPGLDGGDPEFDVVLDQPVGSDGIQRKHLGQPKYEDFTLQVGSNMGKPMYDWIKNSFDKGYVTKNGAITSADYNYKEKSRRAMSTAFITSVTFPALDGASKDPAYLAVSISPTTVTEVPPSGQPVQAAARKPFLTQNFVFEIDGVDTSRVATIDSFTWRYGGGGGGGAAGSGGSGVIDVGDIGVSFPLASLSSWQQWYDNLGSGADDERDGTLTLVGAHGGAVITVGLGRLGLYRLVVDDGRGGSNSGSALRRVKAEMYCEQMAFDYKASWA